MSDDITAAVLASEQERCSAMLAADNAALETILDPSLQFCHATGAVDGKDAFLAKMATGRIRYTGIAWSEEQVAKLAEGVAMLTGRMNTDVEVEGTVKQLRNRVITIWRQSDGNWRLLAFQSTQLKD